MAKASVLADTKSKKRKASASTGDANIQTTNSNKNSSKKQQDLNRAALHADVSYSPLTLDDIHDRIAELSRRLPDVPESGFVLPEDNEVEDTKKQAAETNGSTQEPRRYPQAKSVSCPYDKNQILEWATQIQIVLEEFHLLVACVSPATYIWGSDRSGAAEQNLGLLSGELVRSQEQILARVTPRLNDVLAPVVMLVTDKTVTSKQTNAQGETIETKENHFVTTHEDPDYVNLCYCILARNAKLLRHVTLANFDKLLQSVQDYLTAQHKDSQHDSRGFVY
jgi:hypothetical protein